MLSRRHLLASGIAASALSACSTVSEPSAFVSSAPVVANVPPSTQLASFFEAEFDRALVKYPERATGLGDKRGYDKWDDESDVFAARGMLEMVEANQRLKNLISIAPLNASDALSVRLFDKNTQRAREGEKYRGHAYLFNQMFGAHSSIPTFLANQHKVASVEDAQAYIARLEGVAAKLGTMVDRSNASFARGIMPPKFIYDYVINDSENLLKGAPFTGSSTDSPMWADAQAKINGLNADDATKARLKTAARAALLSSVKPAYDNLLTAMRRQQAGARTTDGVWALPHLECHSLHLR